jgi:hypothetical protein
MVKIVKTSSYGKRYQILFLNKQGSIDPRVKSDAATTTT